MKRLFRFIAITVLIVLLALLTVWGALALWFRLPLPDLARMAAAGGFGLFGLAVIWAQFGSGRVGALVVYALAFAGLLVWWSTIRPPATGDWAPEVARQVTGSIDGDILTLTDLRAFDWRGPDDFTESWQTRKFDLSQIETVDMLLSYWGNPDMAHFMLSFGFADGDYLAWSIEVRRQKGGGFSPIADFFKSNALVVVAAEEQDVVGLRTNIRGEDVQIFRLDVPPAEARRLIEDYVADANALAERPAFFNSITTNCTTAVFRMMRAGGDGIPFDWRMIVNGYLPDLAYERGALVAGVPLSELRARGKIDLRAQEQGLNDGYSQAIREGVPGH